VLPITSTTIRLALHTLAATVWVGGQLTLAGLVPTLRAAGPDVPRMAARQFNKIAWSAYAVLVATGIWNMAATSPFTGERRTTLVVKIVVVAASGVTAYAHTRATSKAGLAVFGALTALTAIAAMFIGVMLH